MIYCTKNESCQLYAGNLESSAVRFAFNHLDFPAMSIHDLLGYTQPKTRLLEYCRSLEQLGTCINIDSDPVVFY